MSSIIKHGQLQYEGATHGNENINKITQSRMNTRAVWKRRDTLRYIYYFHYNLITI